MCGPNWQTESIYVPCNRWCFNDKDILRQFQPQRKKKNHLAGVKIRVDYGVDFNATNWSVHKNLSYTTFEHTRYIMTVMLRNQFRKQTENTAKNLHLNYRALVYCQALCQFSSLIFSLIIDKDWCYNPFSQPTTTVKF